MNKQLNGDFLPGTGLASRHHKAEGTEFDTQVIVLSAPDRKVREIQSHLGAIVLAPISPARISGVTNVINEAVKGRGAADRWSFRVVNTAQGG